MRAKRWAIPAVLLLLAGYAATGLTMVQPDEVGIVRRFGAVLREPWEPGLHWGLPIGLDRVNRVKVQQTRTLAIGVDRATAAPLARGADADASDSLTGDLNLVAAEVLVQYRIREPVAYLFRAADAESNLRAVAEAATARAISHRGIDELLTTGRAELADGLTRSIQQQADRSGLGVSVVAVRLGRVAPPAAVAPAFADAARARSDRRQAVTRAEEYRDRARAEAAGRAVEIADTAAGRAERLVQPAKGEAERFTRVLAEARKAPDSARSRLLLESLAELLPRFRRKVIVAPGQDLDIGLLDDGLGRPTGPEAEAAGSRAPTAPAEGGPR